MKLNLLLSTILCFLFAQSLSAQTPDYLTNGAKWRINSAATWGECWTYKQYVVEITGDTVIGSFTYKKMIHHGFYHYMPPVPSPSVSCPPDETFSLPYSFIRQDSLKLYVYDHIFGFDTLLYDFDLQIGDTLPLSFNNSATDITITNISALQVGTETRKVFHLNNPSNTFIDTSLVEGIGHYWGLTGPFNPFEYWEELICFSLNDTTYFPSFGAFCDLNVGIDEIENAFNILIFPNPLKENLLIQTIVPADIKSIEAIDLLGKSVSLDYNFLDENQIEVKMNELIKGFYTIRITNNLDQIFIYKVLKE